MGAFFLRCQRTEGELEIEIEEKGPVWPISFTLEECER